jgi:glycosyltransferase involved in cell wall biosynthesis
MCGVPATPTASIIVATRGRPDYLEVTLASVAPQAECAGAELIVVCDGVQPASAAVAERHGARVLTLRDRKGANAARNAGVAAATSDLLVLIDDDIEAPPAWLRALLAGVRRSPRHEVFGGPIRARLEGGGPRSCGREPAPITTLELGPKDRDAPRVWSANMAIARSAIDRIGPFDETITGRGEEEEWELRYAAHGGRIRYIADAWLEHRRSPEDATVDVLARASYRLGRTARRNDLRNGAAPPIRRELRTLAGCAWHTVRRRCANGIVMSAHSAGRLREALARPRS